MSFIDKDGNLWPSKTAAWCPAVIDELRKEPGEWLPTTWLAESADVEWRPRLGGKPSDLRLFREMLHAMHLEKMIDHHPGRGGRPHQWRLSEPSS